MDAHCGKLILCPVRAGCCSQREQMREQEVMRLIARGFTYREVAEELFISIKTVETHVGKVLHKLQLSNRHELAHWAAQRRIV